MSIRLLLIEDNPDHIQITKRILEKAGEDFQIDFAMDYEEGITKILEHPYDIILCDYNLPGANALELLKEMRRKRKDIPLVVVTALGSERIAVDLMKEGATDYIVKDRYYEDTLD